MTHIVAIDGVSVYNRRTATYAGIDPHALQHAINQALDTIETWTSDPIVALEYLAYDVAALVNAANRA